VPSGTADGAKMGDPTSLVAPFMANAAESVDLKLVESAEDLEDESRVFHPEFTHQVFGQSDEGEELKIFGYRNLHIQLYYTAAHLNVYLNIKCDETYQGGADGAEADDVVKSISTWLPKDDLGEKPCFTSSLDEFSHTLQQEATFKPLGVMQNRYNETDAGSIDVYMYDGATPGAIEYHQKTMFFLIWMIDGANYIDLKDPNFKVFNIYRRRRTADGGERYTYVGMLSVYEYFTSQKRPQQLNKGATAITERTPLADLDLDGSSERHTYLRPRVSQVLILPPFQKQGHGARLLQTVYNYCNANSKVVDIAVEDPSDGFTMLRDIVDARNCLAQFPKDFFASPKRYTRDVEAALQGKLKLSRSQCRRVFEILQRHLLTKGDDQQAKDYRLFIKKRLIQPYLRQKKEDRRREKNLTKEELDYHKQQDEKHKQSLQLEYDALMQTYDAIRDRLH